MNILAVTKATVVMLVTIVVGIYLIPWLVKHLEVVLFLIVIWVVVSIWFILYDDFKN